MPKHDEETQPAAKEAGEPKGGERKSAESTTTGESPVKTGPPAEGAEQPGAEPAPEPAAEPPADPGTPSATPAEPQALGPFTVLSTLVRDGIEHLPGTVLTFLEHEYEHVRDLIERHVLHPGTGPAARAAVESAERERAQARATPPV